MGYSETKNARATQRNRIKYNQEQVELLEASFSKSQYPDTETLETIADKLFVSVEKVSIWFQNRRSKFKRQSKDTHVAWMRKQLYNIDQISPASCLQPTPIRDEKRHVLSPPEPIKYQEEPTWHKPSSNIHYIPSVPPFMEAMIETFPALTASPTSCQRLPYYATSGEIPRDDSPPQQRQGLMTYSKDNFQCPNSVRQYSLPPRPSCQFFTNSYSLSSYQAAGQAQFPTNQGPAMLTTQGFDVDKEVYVVYM